MNSFSNIVRNAFGNTGAQPYGMRIDQLRGFMLMPQSDSYAIGGYTDDTFIAAIKAKTLLAPALRNYPYFLVKNAVDNTPDATNEATDYGFILSVIHGKPSITITMDNRGIQQIQNMFKFEKNKGMSVVFYDKLATLFGKGTTAGLMKGFKCTISAAHPKIATGSTSMQNMVTFILEDEEAFLNADRFISYRFDAGVDLADEIHGVHDVKLTLASVAATTATVKAAIASTFENMGDSFSSPLAAAGAWIVTNRATGAVVVPSGVTYTAPNFVIAGLTTATSYDIRLNTPAALAALGTPVGNGQTGGFESNVLAVTTA